ncbi:MAG: hypothetical protein AB8B96_03755 [Lysobacterales bacterium]
MVRLLTHFGVACLLLSVSTLTNAAESLWSAVGGETHWQLNVQALKTLGLTLDSPAKGQADNTVSAETVIVALPVSKTSSLEFDGSFGRFNTLNDGSLLIGGNNVSLRGPAGRVSLNNLRLVPLAGTRDAALAAVQSDGGVALTLRYGHFDYQPRTETLNAHIMDAYVGPLLATVVGGKAAEGQYLGQVSLKLEVVAPASPDVERKGTACGASPNWPTQAGFDANLEMQAIDQVVETPTNRSGGRIAVTPSAFFRNVGTADIPWYSMFTVPSVDNITANEGPDNADDSDCIDNGNGQCEPYGVDQGGLLVWSLYRLKDGLLEQLGRSAVKHAWNSINGACGCTGGRVVGAGCTDLYGVGNNSDRNLLGPREEIQAASVLWNKVGSIWDQDSDGRCDVLNPSGFPHDASWCQNTPNDEFDRRLAVLETDLMDPQARYFLEAWYLVRQDVNVFDSMGYQEITPTFNANAGANGLWSFPCSNGSCSTTFVNGPVLNEVVDNSSPAPGSTSSTQDFQLGRVRLTSTVTPLANGRFRYQYTLMNFDFDRGLDGVTIPINTLAALNNIEFSDGDASALNQWSIDLGDSSVAFRAPTSGVLPWGSLISFGFDAATLAQTQTATLDVVATTIPTTLSLEVNAPVGLPNRIFADGLESTPEG